ncbi:MAG: tRNA (adenosine(37)-N6)-dimethylallyltransferase MiaA [Lachnospiraceae bacterium]|nr:tRNA (adenosine(37)-N6)-dimethylallyltransferase MiaA [Lachnospiraceae bacterium]
MEPLVVLTGPTGVGKTELSLTLAKRIGGEIISADSMQVYRGMDIGTAKLMSQDRRGIPHYGIDCVDPTEPWDVTRFVSMAENAIREIRSRGAIPIVVGGTGFYIQALTKGLTFDEEEDDGLRERLMKLPKEELHKMLREVDPESADAIPEGNKKRVVRALVYEAIHHEPISALNERQKKQTTPYNLAYFVLTKERAALYEDINRRVDEMIASGLADEVKRVLDAGCPENAPSMLAIGYRQMLPYLHGECSLTEAADRIKMETRRFAKRQMTWFRREEDVIFLEKDNAGTEELLGRILQKLNELKIWKDYER